MKRTAPCVFYLLFIIGMLSLGAGGCGDEASYRAHSEDDHDSQHHGDDQDMVHQGEGQNEGEDNNLNDGEGCPEGAVPGFPCYDCSDPTSPVQVELTTDGSCNLICPEGATPWRCEDSPSEEVCAGEATLCANRCGSELMFQAECDGGGRWACPEGMVDVESCPEDTCWGSPEACDNAPLFGTWAEEARLRCDGTEVQVEDPIVELIFESDGQFKLTFLSGFEETFIHYWGSYRLNQGQVQLWIDNGNYIPEPFDGEGTLEFIHENQIVVRDVWWGQPQQDGAVEQTCGYILQRE